MKKIRAVFGTLRPVFAPARLLLSSLAPQVAHRLYLYVCLYLYLYLYLCSYLYLCLLLPTCFCPSSLVIKHILYLYLCSYLKLLIPPRFWIWFQVNMRLRPKRWLKGVGGGGGEGREESRSQSGSSQSKTCNLHFLLLLMLVIIMIDRDHDNIHRWRLSSYWAWPELPLSSSSSFSHFSR